MEREAVSGIRGSRWGVIRNVEGVRGDISHETEPNKFLTKTADSLHYSSFSSFFSFFFLFFPPLYNQSVAIFFIPPVSRRFSSLLKLTHRVTGNTREGRGVPIWGQTITRQNLFEYPIVRIYIYFREIFQVSMKGKMSEENNTVKVSRELFLFSLAFLGR